jgi:hypothetical protein
MEVTAKITGIKYDVKLASELKNVNLDDFDINDCPTSCLVADGEKVFAVSKWVSPKRTRSYPYERVYNTLSQPKKITVIPIVKDEGFNGDRDFIQFDTISMMSLLDVYVIFGFYANAEKHRTRKDKITKQKFHNVYVVEKIKEIENYHSSALHWNLKELSENLVETLDKAKQSYQKVSQDLRVRMHGEKGLDDFRDKIKSDIDGFMKFSREKSGNAQAREFVTTQPKEKLQTLTKAKLTITNYLGGKYFLTVDELLIENDTISLIESKHTNAGIIPSKSDIKDGLLKMILFANLKEVSLNGKIYKHKAVLQLTSNRMKGSVSSDDINEDVERFIALNKLKPKQKEFLLNLFDEVKTNNFTVILR